MIYYVHVPIYISEGQPETARRANKHCAIEIEAKSETEAMVKFSDALGALVRKGNNDTLPPGDKE